MVESRDGKRTRLCIRLATRRKLQTVTSWVALLPLPTHLFVEESVCASIPYRDLCLPGLRHSERPQEPL